jgi:hypothetical protein
MKICLVLAAYIWIGLLHSTLLGTFIFAWFGKNINASNKYLWAIVIFAILFFFESYWIPIFNALQIKVFVQDENVLSYFKITNQTNLVDSLSPGIITIISCALQTILALYLGNKFLLKNKING